jgi:hypothetical protein
MLNNSVSSVGFSQLWNQCDNRFSIEKLVPIDDGTFDWRLIVR